MQTISLIAKASWWRARHRRGGCSEEQVRTWTRILDHLDEELDDLNEDDLDMHD